MVSTRSPVARSRARRGSAGASGAAPSPPDRRRLGASLRAGRQLHLRLSPADRSRPRANSRRPRRPSRLAQHDVRARHPAASSPRSSRWHLRGSSPGWNTINHGPCRPRCSASTRPRPHPGHCSQAAGCARHAATLGVSRDDGARVRQAVLGIGSASMSARASRWALRVAQHPTTPVTPKPRGPRTKLRCSRRQCPGAMSARQLGFGQVLVISESGAICA